MLYTNADAPSLRQIEVLVQLCNLIGENFLTCIIGKGTLKRFLKYSVYSYIQLLARST
jgi:hypothetical protein